MVSNVSVKTFFKWPKEAAVVINKIIDEYWADDINEVDMISNDKGYS